MNDSSHERRSDSMNNTTGFATLEDPGCQVDRNVSPATTGDVETLWKPLIGEISGLAVNSRGQSYP